MAIKHFCDMPGCGREVTDYPVKGYVTVENIDFKIEISVLSSGEDIEICQECFWLLVARFDKRPPLLTNIVKLGKSRKSRAK